MKKLFLPLVLCNRDFPEKYCNITVILYNRVLGAKDGCPVCEIGIRSRQDAESKKYTGYGYDRGKCGKAFVCFCTSDFSGKSVSAAL